MHSGYTDDVWMVQKNGQGNVEHIGNNVIKTEQNEGKYRPPDSTFKRMGCQHLLEKVAGSNCTHKLWRRTL
jgi:hypothetical protein